MLRVIHSNRPAAVLLRRVVAYLVDGICILIYAVLLAGLTLLITGTDHSFDEATLRVAIISQLFGLTTLTAPVVLVFAALEAGRLQATPGKRLFGLRVVRANGERLSFLRSLGRNALKFLPWEIAHTGVHHTVYLPDHPLPWFSMTMLIGGQALAVLYLLSVILGRGRTVYDRATDAVVK